MSGILVLTDNPVIGKLSADILAGCGHRVRITGDLGEGFRVLEENGIEVILLDLASPKVPNLKVLAGLQEKAPDVPVIVVASHPTSKIAIDALRAGAYDLISRAILREELLNAVEKAQERRRLNAENRKLLAELQLQVEELSILYEVGKALTSTLELPRVLDLLTQKAQGLFRAEASSLLLLDEQTQELVFAVALGEKGEQVKALRLKKGEGIAGWVAETGTPLLVPDVSQDPRFYAEADRWTQFQTRSILCVPIKVKERVLGAIEVLNPVSGRAFQDRDVALLTALSAQAGIAIENAGLYQRERETVAKLEELSRLKDEFVAAVSQELRKLLAHVIGYAELLHTKEVKEEATREEFIAAIQEESHRLWHLIDEFLDFDKLRPRRKGERGAGDAGRSPWL